MTVDSVTASGDARTPSGPAVGPGAPAFLAGGGAMGALIRSMDWSATPLGPFERWPQSLRTSVGTCLHSRFPILIWWGPELCKIYNDAYQPILGDKHPRAMGQPGRECWPEIWHLIGPMLQGVLERGEATWSENQMLPLVRHGFPEECYFTFSYSPIHDETGGVGGVFCAVTETTGHVLGERRLRSLRTVAAEAGQAQGDEDACARAVAALAGNPDDVPFALVYLRPRGADAYRLVAARGLDAAAVRSGLGEALPGPLPAERDKGAVLVPALDPALAALLAAKRVDVRRAAVVSFGPPSNPAGFLVAGLSPRLAFGDEYRGFVESLAAQVGTAVASARALDDARERAEQLAALDRAKTTFFGNVSHEFRTPLTLLLGPLEEALAAPARRLEGPALRTACRNALRLMKLVNALLDFSRIEAGRLQARFEPVDLAAVTADSASAFRTTVENAGLGYEVDCEPCDGMYVDRDMWEKVVLNLVSNAFKFTLEGTIAVRLRALPGGARLEVRDTGSGIAAADQGRLFRRFERIDNPGARTQEGSGIGLALIHDLVQMHGGEVAVASEPGRGSTFSVTLRRGAAHLPADRVAAPAPGRPARPGAAAFIEEAQSWTRGEIEMVLPGPQPAAERDGEAPGRVLVADDNADMREYIGRLLSPAWEVECVPDGEAALAALARRAFDLVITDVMMPKMDGFALLAAIRASKPLEGLPVVMLSARAGEEARIEGLDAGADDYLVKPFGGRELAARVRSQLQLKRARDQIAEERSALVAQEQAARREAQLQKEHLESLLMQAPVPMCVLRGPRHVIEIANAQICRAWRRAPADVVGRAVAEALPEAVGQGFVALLDGVLASGETYVGREAPLRLSPDAPEAVAPAYFDFVYAPLKAADGRVEGVLVVAFDITHEVLARRELGGLRARAEEASRAKDEFLAMLGHELRNPLSPIVTALQLMRLRGGALARAGRDRAAGHGTRPAGRRPARRLAHHPRQGGAAPPARGGLGSRRARGRDREPPARAARAPARARRPRRRPARARRSGAPRAGVREPPLECRQVQRGRRRDPRAGRGARDMVRLGCRTRAAGSLPSCSSGSSSRSSSSRPTPTAPGAAWAWGSRSCATSSGCTAARCRCRARPARAASSSWSCRRCRPARRMSWTRMAPARPRRASAAHPGGAC